MMRDEKKLTEEAIQLNRREVDERVDQLETAINKQGEIQK